MQRSTGWAVVWLFLFVSAGCGAEFDQTEFGQEGNLRDALDLDNLVPGRGYDLVADTASDFCLESTSATPIEETGGQDVVFSLQIVEDSKTLARQMEVSAAASIKFGFAGGEAKAKFVEESELSQTSVYALATVKIRNSPRVVRDTALKGDAIETLARNPLRFRERCGDGYISSIRTGGEFFGLLEVSTSTESEKEELTASIKASGMTWSAEASFRNAVNSSVAHKSVKVRTIQLGGAGAQAAPCMDVACLLARVHDMPQNVQQNPVVVGASVLSYRKVGLPHDVKTPIDTQVMQEIEADLVNARLDIRDARARYMHALRHPQQFVAYKSDELQKAIHTCEAAINAINKTAIACYRDFNLCVMPEFSYPSTRLPRRKEPCEVVIAMCLQDDWDELDEWQRQCQATGASPIDLVTCVQRA